MIVIIEDEEGWSVSLTSSNPEREDCIDCRTYEDAERLYNFGNYIHNSLIDKSYKNSQNST